VEAWPEEMVGASFADRHGPQTGLFGGRWNPIHTMLATGTDAVAGRQDKIPGIRYADDAINMPVQCATHWDSLGHMRLVVELEEEFGVSFPTYLLPEILDADSIVRETLKLKAEQ